MKEISVIIPTYKPKEYIYECLESLYNQTLDKSKYEVIIILNGCNEPWSSDISNWIGLHKDMLTQLYVSEIAGVSNARNIGIDKSKGQYITFIDDDDYVSETYLEGLLSKTRDCQDAVILSNTNSFIDGHSDFNESYSLRKTYYKLKNNRGQISLLRARSIFNGPWMKLIPSSFIKGNYFDTRFKNSEDALYMYMISKEFNKILLAPENCVYYHRFRIDSAVSCKKSNVDVINNQFKFITSIFKLYFRNPMKYNIAFTISRILAALKTIYLQLKK